MSGRRFAISGWLVLCLISQGAAHAATKQTVVVVLDDSGSMQRNMGWDGHRMDAAKSALSSVLGQLTHDTEVGVLALNSQVEGSYWIVPIGSPDASRWQHTLEKVNASGGTPLGERMRTATDALLQLRAKQPYDEYRLLVVTDGEATDAPLLESILPDLMSRGIRMDVIGVAMQAEHSLARLAHSYRSASDKATLTAALSQVFAETSLDGQSSEKDFQLLGGLPDEVAGAVVKELSAPRNSPLSSTLESPIPEDILQNAQSPDLNTTFTNPASNYTSAKPKNKPGFIPAVLTIITIVVVIRVVRKMLDQKSYRR